jgi:hypothetical protein
MLILSASLLIISAFNYGSATKHLLLVRQWTPLTANLAFIMNKLRPGTFILYLRLFV